MKNLDGYLYEDEITVKSFTWENKIPYLQGLCHDTLNKEELVMLQELLDNHEWQAATDYVLEINKDLGCQHYEFKWITKWNPGEHYWALDKKFNDIKSAIKHLESKRYKMQGVRNHYVFVYCALDGD